MREYKWGRNKTAPTFPLTFLAPASRRSSTISSLPCIFANNSAFLPFCTKQFRTNQIAWNKLTTSNTFLGLGRYIVPVTESISHSFHSSFLETVQFFTILLFIFSLWIMYQSVPSQTIPPGQNPQAIFWWANSPPLTEKEFKTSTPRPVKTS